MRRSILVVVAMVFLAGSTIGRAHHSYAEFLDYTVSVEGTLEKAAFASPHTILTVRTKESALYSATWNAAFQLKSMGVQATDLKVGEVIILTGYPSRDPNAHHLAKLREVRQPSHGWGWRMENGRVTIQRAG